MGNSNSGFNKNTTATQVAEGFDLTGKGFIVTGANSGIGYHTAEVLATKGATVVLACRSEERGKATETSIRSTTGNDNVHFLKCDLGDLESVRDFSVAFSKLGAPLNCLINNAGIMALPKIKYTKQKIERQWGVNHIGHFYLTTLLLPKLRENAPSRVVNLASSAHTMAPKKFSIDRLPPTEKGYGDWRNYGISKMSNILFSHEFNRRYQSEGITSYAVHPGVILTNLARDLSTVQKTMFTIISPIGWLLGKFKSIAAGSATTTLCALHDVEPGRYYFDCAVQDERPDGKDPEQQRKLWELSERLLGDLGFGSTSTAVSG